MNKNLVMQVAATGILVKTMIIITPSEVDSGTVSGDITISPWEIEGPLDEMKAAFEINQLHEFIEAIGLLESDNTYNVVNRYGMLGKYQFAPSTIEYLGYDVTDEEFLNNPDLQDEVMMTYLRGNYVELYDYIMEYDGKMFKGIDMNTASILAGAHFAGATGLKRFLENASDSIGVVDGNGTSLRYYMNRFSQYTIDLD